MSFLAALGFLTIIPLSRLRGDSVEKLGRAAGYFPAAGVVIGLILAGLDWILSRFMPQNLVSILLVIFLILITGAIHLDGVVDTCDGLAGHKTVEERLLIMRDSRAGGFGVIGAAVMVLLKYVSLSSVPVRWMIPTLIIMPAASRWVMTYAIFAYPYARPAGLGQAFKQGITASSLVLATVTTLVITLLVVWLAGVPRFYQAGLAILLVAWLVTVALSTFLKSKFAGLTGDTYGMINEVAEVSVLLLVVLLAHNHWFGFV